MASPADPARTFDDLHDLHNRGIDHLVEEQLGSLHDPLSSPDYGQQPLRHDKKLKNFEERQLRNFHCILLTPNPPGTCHCTPTGMQRPAKRAAAAQQEHRTPNVRQLGNPEDHRDMPLRHNREDDDDVDKLQLRNLHSFPHNTVTCQVPPREQWRRKPPRTCAQTCPNKCSHLHHEDKEKSTIQRAIGTVLQKPVATHSGWEDRHQKTHTPPNS